MNLKRKYVRILLSTVLLSVHGTTILSCAFADNSQKTAMEFLSKSVKERDERLIAEIKADEAAEKGKDEKAVAEFLANEPVTVEPLDIKARPISKQDAVSASIVHYHNTGNTEPILMENGLVLYPFGLSEPTVVCAPLRICHIELEEGEEIIDTNPGDTQRWWFGYTFVGESGHIQPHVLVKPLVEVNIETNLSISTNRRLYYIILKSVTDGAYTKRIGFFYPQDFKKETRTLDELKSKLYRYEDKETLRTKDSIPVTNLNFNYNLKGSKKSKFYPQRVFDDGKKVYIQMSENIQSYELPVFMVLGKGDRYEAVNYRFNNPYYIVDRLFDKGVLFLTNESSREEKIVIVNNTGVKR
jgi:type IV secretion system protein VirB9